MKYSGVPIVELQVLVPRASAPQQSGLLANQ
jgi:hypothetical protein